LYGGEVSKNENFKKDSSSFEIPKLREEFWKLAREKHRLLVDLDPDFIPIFPKPR
jgi:hypothetical protein